MLLITEEEVERFENTYLEHLEKTVKEVPLEISHCGMGRKISQCGM